MPTCPNCFYQLVLLKHRGKYKCAKCGRLFFQKEIDTKEFIEMNKRQREADKKALNNKPKKLTESERKQNQLASSKKWREANPEKIKEYKLKNKQACQKYYENNKEKFLTKNRKYRKENGQAIKQRRKNRRLRNVEGARVLNRIGQLRIKQKQLAVQNLEFAYIKAYTPKIQSSLPTLLLS